MPSSPNQNSISSLIITAPNSTTSSNSSTKMQTNADEIELKLPSVSNNTIQLPSSKAFKQLDMEKSTPSASADNQNTSKFLWPPVSAKHAINNNQSEETSNKYTFKPIQLPAPSASGNSSGMNGSSFQLTKSNNKNQVNILVFFSLFKYLIYLVIDQI